MRLCLMGQVSLTAGDGREIDAILARPKALAVLVYLTVAYPSGYQRRDKLLALFWPEFDGERARHALRQTCYVLRRALPGAIARRGAEELCVKATGFWCDATAMERAFRSGRHEEVCELYRGDLADGLHVPGAAAEFDQWMSAERERLRRMAKESAWHLSDAARRAGDGHGAAGWAARAVDVAPFDEMSVRREIETLDHIGDRAGAIRAYERFARCVRSEFDTDPAPETQALVRTVRRRMEETGAMAAPEHTSVHWRRSALQHG